MSTDKDTKKRLIESARREFIKKGYNQASLRSICSGAGVTTGALYFFFTDKDDLFHESVREPLEELYSVVRAHFKAEAGAKEWSVDSADDVEAAMSIVRVLFKRRDLLFINGGHPLSLTASEVSMRLLYNLIPNRRQAI